MHAEALKLRLSFDGSFGPGDALRTSGLLEGTIHGALVNLDFAHCREVDPTALAHLTETILAQGGKVALLGLSRHDLRILHYLIGPWGETQPELEEPG